MKFLILLILSYTLYAKEIPNFGLNLEPWELYSSVKDAATYISNRSVSLPTKIDLGDKMPPAGYQGKQGSCVAWSSTYAVKSYHEYIERVGRSAGWGKLAIEASFNPKTVFSPAFVYNQINNGKDSGATLYEALSFLVLKGAVPWENMPYDQKDYLKKPSPELSSIAIKYQAKEFYKVNFTNLSEIKTHLAKGNPVMAGILVTTGLLDLKGSAIYSSPIGQPMGGHAITIVGYDDNIKAFKYLNSWGQEWGDKGFGYIDYKFFQKICRICYVMIDQVDNANYRDLHVRIDSEIQPGKISPPKEVNATKGNYSDKVVLTWSAEPGAVGYEIHRAFPDEKNFHLIGLSKNTSFFDTGVHPDIAYSYRITSVSEKEISAPSEMEVIGFASSKKKDIPPKIAGLKASNGKYPDKILLQWQPIQEIGLYQVFKWDEKAKTFKAIAKVKTNFYEDKTASKSGTIETYAVAAIENNKVGMFSDSAIGRTEISSRLKAPVEIVASQGLYSDKIEVKWSKVNGAAGYLIYKFDEDKWTPVGEVEVEAYIDQNPGKGQKMYTVVAKSKENTLGEFSEKVIGFADTTIKRNVKRIPAPTGFTANLIKGEEVRLQWDENKNVDEYTIWYKKQGSDAWLFLTKAYGDTSFVTQLPETDTLFLYTISAHGKEGEQSGFAPPQSVVHSIAKKSPLRRNFSDSSKLDTFRGSWTGMLWDGHSRVKNISMDIQVLNSNTVQITLDNKKSYEVKYVLESTEIELEDKFRIKISSNDALMVELKDKTIVNEKVELAFLRE
jgi:C1A family cysteine protease/fibronectin type 3 domain-containing protein